MQYQLPRLVRSDEDWFADMISQWVKADAAKRQAATANDEALALIRLLRDTTDSQSIHQRCVAIVGER